MSEQCQKNKEQLTHRLYIISSPSLGASRVVIASAGPLHIPMWDGGLTNSQASHLHSLSQKNRVFV
jgi:hypothetical protein